MISLRISRVILFLMASVFADQVLASDFWSTVTAYVNQSEAVKQADQMVSAKEGLRARHLLFNNPTLVFNSNDDGATYQYGIGLPVGFPGKVVAQYNANDAEVKAARVDRLRARQSMTFKAAEDILNCLENREKVTAMAQSLKDAQDQYDFLKEQYTRGFVSHTEFILAELQLNQLQYDDELLKSKSFELCQVAESTYGITAEIKMPEHILPPAQSWDFGEGTLEQKQLKSDTITLEAKKKTLYWEQLPDLNLTFLRNNYKLISASPYQNELEPRAWTSSFGVSVTIPLFWPFDENLQIKAKRAEYLTELEEKQRDSRNALADMKQMKVEFKKGISRLDVILKKELPLAERLKSYSLQNFRTGKISFAELVLARKTALETRLQKIDLNSKLILLAIRCGGDCRNLEETTQ